MGLDIGFTLYEKKPFDEEGKLVAVEPDDIHVGLLKKVLFFLKNKRRYKKDPYENWRCGWGKPNESWGSLFEFGEVYKIPVFQKELAGKSPDKEDSSEEYKLVDFDEFADYVHEACTNEYHEASEQRNDARKTIAEYEAAIKELRELQMRCAEKNAYAFDRWTTEINELKDKTDFLKRQLSEKDFGDEHQAKSVNALLDAMEKYLKEDKYYIIPYFDC